MSPNCTECIGCAESVASRRPQTGAAEKRPQGGERSGKEQPQP